MQFYWHNVFQPEASKDQLTFVVA